MDELVPIASSVERPSLERLEKYLRHHGILCQWRQEDAVSVKFQLMVLPSEIKRAQGLLADIAYSSHDLNNVEEVIEIQFDGTERIEVASWLQVLLDEEDHEGSPVYFFKTELEFILDELHAFGRVELPLFIINGLKGFIPKGPRRMQMGQGLQEFFTMIEAVAEGDG